MSGCSLWSLRRLVRRGGHIGFPPTVCPFRHHVTLSISACLEEVGVRYGTGNGTIRKRGPRSRPDRGRTVARFGPGVSFSGGFKRSDQGALVGRAGHLVPTLSYREPSRGSWRFRAYGGIALAVAWPKDRAKPGLFMAQKGKVWGIRPKWIGALNQAINEALHERGRLAGVLAWETLRGQSGP